MGLSGEMLELLLENIDCGLFTVDTECRITSWNSAAEKITGFKSGEMIGRSCRELSSLSCFSDCTKDNDNRMPDHQAGRHHAARAEKRAPDP